MVTAGSDGLRGYAKEALYHKHSNLPNWQQARMLTLDYLFAYSSLCRDSYHR